MIYLLHQILSVSALKYPDHKAAVFKDRDITYAELENQSNRLALGLQQLGILRGDRVAIYLNRSIESIVSVFGVLKAGAAYVPIDPLCPPERLKYIVDKCQIKAILTSENKLKKTASVFPGDGPLESILVMDRKDEGPSLPGATKTIAWPLLCNRLTDREAPDVDMIDHDIAYILFTSGSTGNPKGVILSHSNALTFIKSAYGFFDISADDRFSNICPLHFDMSVFDLYVAFMAGATVVIIPETDAVFPLKIAEYIETHQISVWNSVPSALCMLAAFKDLDRYQLQSLRLILFAGEIFPLKHLSRLKEIISGARFCNMYGQTEANSSMYYWVDQLPADMQAVLPIGKAMPNFEVFALDREGKRVTEPGQEGELYVRASTVAQGYWEEPEKTNRAFVPDPLQNDSWERVYKTGDLVRLDGDRNFIFLGRLDHMIKSRGYRIEIGEIESVLRSHPDIEDAVIIPIPDELIGNRIHAIVLPSPNSNLGRKEAVLFCSKRLPKYMMPETIEFRNSFPRTSSGKVDRKKLGESMLN